MLNKLTTEARNPRTERIDELSAVKIVEVMQREDAAVADAIAAQAAPIATVIDVVADRIRNGGRLVYLGAGTSGRLGVLDASECPPTFSTPPEMVVGVIAGGTQALTRAIEGAEDSPEGGKQDLRGINLSAADVLVGIATSGRTPYVLGGLRFAREIGAYAVGLSCNRDSALVQECDLCITPVVGPEVITGSTRLKAGTATKLVLNMISTGAMIRLGKTYGNLMVDLRATNSKLMERSHRIVSELTGLSTDDARAALRDCDGELKTAVVVHECDVDPESARALLRRAGGHLRMAFQLRSAVDER